MVIYSRTTDNKYYDADDGDTGGSTSSGSAGDSVVFYDFLTNKRTKALSPTDERIKLAELNHKTLNNIAKTKEKQRQQSTNQSLLHGVGSTTKDSLYQAHPLLSTKQQFDGIDPKVNLDPMINEAETNDEITAELKYAYQLRFGLEQQPQLTITPKPTMIK
jgi:hypothetical protein